MPLPALLAGAAIRVGAKQVLKRGAGRAITRLAAKAFGRTAVKTAGKVAASGVVKTGAAIVVAEGASRGVGRVVNGPAARTQPIDLTGAGPMRGSSGGFGGSRRRMNPYNPRALRKAMARLSAFRRGIDSTDKALTKLARKVAPKTRPAPAAKSHRHGSCSCK